MERKLPSCHVMRHSTLRLVVVSLGLLWSACIDIPGIHVEEPPIVEPDAGVPTVGARLILSRQTTNGGVDLQVELTGASPEKVELLVDGSAVETLLPPYRLHLDTQTLSEGDRELLVRTTLGSRIFLSEPRLLRVDRTPPAFVSRHPAPGDRLVPVQQVVRAEFSKELDPATVHGNSVRLEAESKVITGEVALSSDAKVLTIRPTALLPKDVSVRVVLDSSVTDLAGNPIQTEGSEWSWVAPGFLPLGSSFLPGSMESSAPTNPDLLVPKSGGPIAIWGDNVSQRLYARQWSGVSWEPMGEPVSISGTFSFLESTLDVEDRPVVAWLDDTSVVIDIRRWTGSAWVPMGEAIPSSTNYLWALSLRTDGEGQWFLSYATYQEFFVWKWDGTAWMRLALFKAAEGWKVAMPCMELDVAGNPVVIWGEMDSASKVLRYETRWWDGGAWRTVPGSVTYPGAFGWGVGAPGHPLMWVGTSTGASIRAWTGTGWSQLGASFEERFPGDARAVVRRFALDSSGALVVLLGEAEGAEQYETLHMRKLVDGEWLPLEGLLRPSPGSTPNPASQLEITPEGRFLVARIESTGQPPHVQYFMQVYISND
ncbi:Ig-like domain-containing protein [Myxococcus fulvus]|uniref:Ig-like domain-containing protein n=1 Tax=Myxococcus fulvus TaxID=33 RepID=UPI003B9934C3